MSKQISQRLLDITHALPLKQGQRILEIGCGPGTAAREIVNRFDSIFVLGIDRSQKAIDQAIKLSKQEIASGNLKFQTIEIENFEIGAEEKFDFAFAVRVGALDGRHPEIEKRALARIKQALKKGGKLYIDGGNPLKTMDLK